MANRADCLPRGCRLRPVLKQRACGSWLLSRSWLISEILILHGLYPGTLNGGVYSDRLRWGGAGWHPIEIVVITLHYPLNSLKTAQGQLKAPSENSSNLCLIFRLTITSLA